MIETKLSVDKNATAGDVLKDVLEELDHVNKGIEIAGALAEEHGRKACEVEYGDREYEEAMQRRFAHLVRKSVYEEMASRLTKIINRYAGEK